MVNTKFSPMVIDAIGEAMNISLGSSATAVSNMLDHRVDITTPSVQVINAEEFTIGRIEPAVGVEIKYVSGLEGSNIMMLKRNDVKAIVDILLGTETPDEEFQLDELSVSVVCEVMNQMMGAASTALSDLLGRMVNISTPESFELTDLDKVREEHFPVKSGPIVVVRFQLTIKDVLESEFMNIMSVDLALEMVKGMGVDVDAEEAKMAAGGDAAPAPEAAPAAAPAPAPAPAAAAPEPSPAPSGRKLSQEEIEKLLAGGIDGAPAAEPAPAPAAPAAAAPAAPAPAPAAAPQAAPPAQMPPMPGADGQMPYPQMPAGYPYPPYPYYPYPPQPAPQPAPPPEPKVIATQKPRMEALSEDSRLSEEQQQNLDLIMGVSLEVAVEIGRTRRKIQDIIAFSKGSLVVLDKLAGEPVDLLVNGQCIARGDVVVIDDNFGIRITEILQKPDINELTKF